MKALELRETLSPSKEKLPSDLATFLKTKSSQDQPSYTMLLGAGASRSSGIRTASELVEVWRKEIYLGLNLESSEYDSELAKSWLSENYSDWYDAESEYSCLFEKIFDLAPQRRVFVEEEVENGKPSIGYAYFSSLIDHQFVNTVFTTNFDDLINEALFRFSKVRPISCAHDSSISAIRISSKRPKIIKLHGDYLYDDLKCTQSETESLQVNMRMKLEQFLREFGLIVIGYSGNDKSVMSVLSDLIQKEEYLRYGVYWVFREEDEISQHTLELLKQDKAYYVLESGFDDFMAKIYKANCGNKLPFSNSEFLTSSSDLTDHWLKTDSLQNSSSPIIQSHLEELKKGRKTGALAKAFSEVIEDEDTQLHEGNINNDELLILIELGNQMNNYQYDEVIESVRRNIPETQNKTYKTRLLKLSLAAHKRQGNFRGARKICEEILLLENSPKNLISYARNLEKLEDKIEVFERAIAQDNFHWPAYHYIGDSLSEAVSLGLHPNNEETKSQIVNSYNDSLIMNPSMSNPSWNGLFDFILEFDADNSQKESDLLRIISEIQKQDKYSPKVCNLVLAYCSKFNSAEFDNSTIFEFLKEACAKYYPKNHPSMLYYIARAGEKFENHSIILDYENEFDSTDIEYRTTKYYLAKSSILLNVHRDIDGAVKFLEENISEDSNGILLSQLIKYLIYANELNKARILFERHSNDLSIEKRINIESSLLTEEGKYSEAIKQIESLSSIYGYDEKYSQDITYVYIKKGDFLNARNTAAKILNRHNFDQNLFSTLIINYEFAQQRVKNKQSSKNHRIDEIFKNSKDQSVKAMAALLMGNTQKCVEILVKECEKDFSNYYQYQSWPIAQSVIARLQAELNVKNELQSVS